MAVLVVEVSPKTASRSATEGVHKALFRSGVPSRSGKLVPFSLASP